MGSYKKDSFIIMFPEQYRIAGRLVGSKALDLLVVLCGLSNGNVVDFRLRDLSDHMLVSVSTLQRRLAKLREKGLIQKDGHHWIVNGRVLYKGRLADRSDNILEFEEKHFNAEYPPDGAEDDDPEGEGSGGDSAEGGCF